MSTAGAPTSGPTGAPEVRAVRPGDLDAVTRIYAHYVEHSVATFDLVAPDRASWAAKVAVLTDAGWPFLVAATGESVVGFAYVSPWRDRPAYRHTVEDTIYLAPGETGRGTGRRLLTELLVRASANGARQVLAVIADGGDDASMALHRALGFVEAGRLRAVGVKHGRTLDTVLLQGSPG